MNEDFANAFCDEFPLVSYSPKEIALKKKWFAKLWNDCRHTHTKHFKLFSTNLNHTQNIELTTVYIFVSNRKFYAHCLKTEIAMTNATGIERTENNNRTKRYAVVYTWTTLLLKWSCDLCEKFRFGLRICVFRFSCCCLLWFRCCFVVFRFHTNVRRISVCVRVCATSRLSQASGFCWYQHRIRSSVIHDSLLRTLFTVFVLWMCESYR